MGKREVWGSVVSSPGGIRGRAPPENGFWCFVTCKLGRSHIVNDQFFPTEIRGQAPGTPPAPWDPCLTSLSPDWQRGGECVLSLVPYILDASDVVLEALLSCLETPRIGFIAASSSPRPPAFCLVPRLVLDACSLTLSRNENFDFYKFFDRPT